MYLGDIVAFAASSRIGLSGVIHGLAPAAKRADGRAGHECPSGVMPVHPQSMPDAYGFIGVHAAQTTGDTIAFTYLSALA
jgi:hypothetical protein